jgi:hypothetical protein
MGLTKNWAWDLKGDTGIDDWGMGLTKNWAWDLKGDTGIDEWV